MSRQVDNYVDVTITNDLGVGFIDLSSDREWQWTLISGDHLCSDLNVAKLSSYHSTCTDVLLLRTCLPTELVSANF